MTLFAKLYTDILGDAKLMRASRKGARHLVILPWLFAFAKEADDDGRLTVNGEPAEAIDIAEQIPGVAERQVAACLESLEEIGVLARDPDGALRLTAWEWRSGNAKKPSDEPERVSARVTRHRAAKRARRNARNADAVTPETPIEKEQEKEQEKEPEKEQELRESAADTIELLARVAFGGAFDEIERFLGTRKAETRENWLREMIKIVSPGSQYVAADVTGACSDALALEKPIGGPHALRAFAEKRRQERTPVPPSERAGARRGSSIGILSASDAYVDKIMALMQSTTNGRGVVEFIPKTKVAELGAQVLAAYSAIGGVDRFLVAKKEPDKLVWLRRDFSAAFANAIHATPPTTEAAGASP